MPEKPSRWKNFSFNWGDLYHYLLVITWKQFFFLTTCIYLITNVLFALAYLIQKNAIENARPGSFIDAFSFSVQTMATIGYGAMYPRTIYAHILVAIEVFLGLLGVAMATGLMLARFSKPTARILFSKVAVISSYNGIPTLMFRSANQRNNFIVQAQVQVSFLRSEISQEGHQMRRFHNLNLLRSQTPIFAYSWTIMHPIDKKSPLLGLTSKDLSETQGQIIVVISGLDETVSQTVHARHSYNAEDIRWSASFVDVLFWDERGQPQIDYSHFHDVKPLGNHQKGLETKE
ncbi:MAG: ion channel [Spirulinaceae cyanobacterium]